MKGKWKVSHNYAGGERLIQVYRQLDVTEPDHAGNREYKPGFFETDEEAQALADSLNTKHWKISYSMLYRNGSVQEAEATIAADTIDQALKMAQLNITKPILQTGAYEDIVIWDVAIMEDDVF